MPVGLQLWDEDGNLILDATTRLGRVYETFSSGTANGTRTFSALLDGGEPFFFVEDNSADLPLAQLYAYPNVSINGGVVSWSFVDYQYPTSSNNVPRRAVNISVGTY